MEGLNTNYAVQSDVNGPSYPAIQASTYEPRSLKEKVGLCFSEEALNLLSEAGRVFMMGQGFETVYNGNDATMYRVPDNIRWVALGQPKLFLLHKQENRIDRWERGTKLGNGVSTITRVPFCAIAGGDTLVETEAGEPQIFTLKLTSNRTSLVNGDRREPELKSLQSLNEALCKHYKISRASLVHLVSLNLGVEPITRKNNNGESKISVRFVLNGNAKALPEAVQARMAALVSSEEVRAMLADPFGVLQLTQPATTAPIDSDDGGIDPDDMPF